MAISIVHYVLPSLAVAQQAQALLDAALSYPKPGVNYGAWPHLVPTYVTLTYYAPLKHPTLSQWAMIADAIAIATLAPQAAQLGLPVPIALDATWSTVASVGT